MVEVNIGILCACVPTLRPLISKAQRQRTKKVNGFTIESGKKNIAAMTATSGTIAIAIGATIRDSYRPPVPPKSPSYNGSLRLSPTYSNRYSPTTKKVFDVDLDSAYSSRANSPNPNSLTPKPLAILKRDENGIFRPEKVLQRSP